jgi:hypothetical protein
MRTSVVPAIAKSYCLYTLSLILKITHPGGVQGHKTDQDQGKHLSTPVARDRRHACKTCNLISLSPGLSQR